jgi:hypothetical protein
MSEMPAVTAGVETEAQWEAKTRDQTHFITALKHQGSTARIIAENKGFSKTFNGIQHVEINGVARVTFRKGVLAARGGLKAHAHDNLLLVYSHD